MTREPPFVHILLLTWNGWQDTVDCLESLFRLDYPNFSVVVCDNASDDGSVEKIRGWAASGVPGASRPPEQLRGLVDPPTPKPLAVREYTREQAEAGGDLSAPESRLTVINTGRNLGFAGGNNVGLRYILARGGDGLIWVLNNDILVARDSLSKLVECWESREGIGAVSGTLLYYTEPDRLQMAGGGRFMPWTGMATPTHTESGRTPDYVTAGCMLVPASAVRRVGLLDERYFMYVEDVDYSLRLRRAGLSLVYCSAARAWHKGNVSVQVRSERHDYYTIRNSLMLAHRFYPALLPSVFAYTAYRCLLPKVLRGQFRRARAVLCGYRDFTQRVVGPMPALARNARQ